MDFFRVRPLAGICALACILTAFTATSASMAHGDHGGGSEAGVLPDGITLVTLQYDTVDYRPISDARLAALATSGVDGVHSLRTIAVPSLSIARGFTPDFTISARLPYLMNSEIRETDVASGGIDARGGVYGFGDVSVLGTYRFFSDHASGLDATVSFGVKAPTGLTNRVDQSGVLFETEHQPGSGSWDGLFGAALSKQLGQWTIGANALYARTGAGSQDTRLGDHMNYGVSAGYRICAQGGGHDDAMHLGAPFDGMMRHGGVDHAAAVPSTTIDVSLGLNGQWSAAQVIAREADGNTGGNIIYLTPGVRMTVEKWSSFVSVGVPIARQLNGIQSEPRLQVSSGVSVRF